MPYIEKRIESGDLLEIRRYYSPTMKQARRERKEQPSTEKQQIKNDKEAEKWLVRKINTNFSKAKKDLFVTLTYREEISEEAAAKEAKNFIRRVQRRFKKEGKELKYLIITEKQGMWHHHVIMSYMALDQLDEIWGKGRVTASILDPTNNFQDLASYLSKNFKPSKGAEEENGKEERRKYKRRWNCSKNLQNPKVTVKPIKRCAIMRKEPKAPKHYLLLPNWELGSDGWGNLYQYFNCKRIH